MKQVLILGNNGYVGSALTNQFTNECEVTGVDTCWFGPNLGKSLVQNMSSLTTDFLTKFDVIVCLAAHSSVQLAVLDPKGAVENNIVNLNRLMYSLLPHQRLIYASSASVYGNHNFDAKEGQENYQMHNMYDITKQTGDDLAKHYISQGKNIVGVRFGTICGISPNTRTDLAINNMLLTAFRKGSFWVSNIHTYRSFLSVSDAASAIAKMSLSKNFKSGIYNIKSFDCNMSEVATAIYDITGYNYEVINAHQTSYDYTVSIDKIYNDYKWQPKFTLRSLVEEVQTNLPTLNECRRDCFNNNGVLNE